MPSSKNGLLIEFGLWMIQWEDGKILGPPDAIQHLSLSTPPPNGWGPHPSAKDFESAVLRRDSFLDMMRLRHPEAKIVEYGPGEPEDVLLADAIY